jgi:hypothetical protein
MKYLLLIQQFDRDVWQRFSEDEKAAIYADYKVIAETPGVSPGLLLQPAEMATTVRMQDGKTLTTDGPLKAGELPGGPVITTWHLGAHDSLGDAYGRLAAWLTDHDREAAGPAWEVYWWIDASQEPDPSLWPAPTEWRTELVQPLAVQSSP